MKTRVFLVLFNKTYNEVESTSEPEAIFFEWDKAEDYIQSIRSEWDKEDGIEYSIHEKFIDL